MSYCAFICVMSSRFARIHSYVARKASQRSSVAELFVIAHAGGDTLTTPTIKAIDSRRRALTPTGHTDNERSELSIASSSYSAAQHNLEFWAKTRNTNCI
jgi:hypothetical protein